jgi:hypothetical protein
MNNFKFLISVLIILFSLSSFAEGVIDDTKSIGILRGQVIDAKTGEAIIGCQVIIISEFLISLIKL